MSSRHLRSRKVELSSHENNKRKAVGRAFTISSESVYGGVHGRPGWSRLLEPEDIIEKHDRMLPETRGECPTQRPCPHVSCKWHLFLDVKKRGGVKVNYPVEPLQLKDTCTLDLAEMGGLPLWRIGDALNVTRERIRQTIQGALEKIRHLIDEHPEFDPLVRVMFHRDYIGRTTGHVDVEVTAK